MKTQNITLIICAVFSIVILLASNNIDKVYALTITDIALGSAPSVTRSGDTFFDTSLGIAERWITSGGSVKVINMRTNVLITTITPSGGGVTDVKCGSAWCFLWQSTTTPFRIWAYDAYTRSFLGVINGTDGNEGGSAIEVLDTQTGGLGGITVFVPLHNTNCDGLGGGNYVIAEMDGSIIATSGTFADACSGILSIGDFVTAIAHSGLTQQVVGDNRNTLAVGVLNAVTQNFQIYNLPTQARVCDATAFTGDKGIVMEDGTWWVYGSTGTAVIGYDRATSGVVNCVSDRSISVPTNYQIHGIDIDEVNNIVYMAVQKNDGTDNYISARNQSATTVELSRYDMKDGGGSGVVYYYSVDDELFANSNIGQDVRVFGFGNPTGSDDGSGGNSSNGRCGVGTVLDCIGDRSVGLAVTGGSDITTVSETLFCGIGFNTTCSGDPKENGTGLLLMLITGVFFSGIVIITIATANTRFGAGISYTEIPKELWLFLVVGVVALSFYFQWIPDIVFYGMMVGLAGLFSFGLYKHIRGG